MNQKISGEPWDFYMITQVQITDEYQRIFEVKASKDSIGVWPFPADEVFIMTAWNPRSSDQCSPQMNVALNDGLRQRLERLGAILYSADGHDPASTWVECGFAVMGLTQDQVVACAVEYQQNAVYRIRPGEFTCVGALLKREESRALSIMVS